MNERTYEGWVAAYNTGTDYEADIIRDRLDDAGIPAVILTHRDHAFNLNVGDLSGVSVMVPPERLQEAVTLIETPPLTDAELDEAAMASDPASEPAHDRHREASLDSGIEEINFSVPDDDEERP